MKPIDVWKIKLEKYRSSNLSQKQWCHENQESLSCFKYWICRFNKIKKQNQGSFKELTNPISKSVNVHCGQFSVEIPPDFDEIFLSKILKLMRHA